MPPTQASPSRLAGRPGHNRGQKLHAEPLTGSEVEAIITAMNGSATGDRNRALVAVLYGSGLRIAEALALRPADIDHANQSIRILHAKGAKARTVGVPPATLYLIDRWLARRVDLGLSNHGNAQAPIFCRLDGSPLSRQAFSGALKRAATKAGIVKRVHPHGFRHTNATEMVRDGVDLARMQGHLGHSSPVTTARYLASVAPVEVIAASAARVPAGLASIAPTKQVA